MRLFSAALGTAAFLLASDVGATIVVPMTIEDMAVEAAVVARGRVANTQATWDENQRRIYTYTEIQILERIHAPSAVPSSVVVRTLGGEVGNVGMKVSGTPKFTLGEEVVVFLRTDTFEAGQFTVIGMSQGKFRVDRSLKGAVTVLPSVEGLAFARPGADGTMKIDAHAGDSARVALTTLRTRVRSALEARGVPTAPATPTAPAPAQAPAQPAQPAVPTE